MQYRIDKRSGNKLSVLGFGCMHFPKTLVPGNPGGIDMRKTEEMIMHSIERGVNYFDTAWFYQGSEQALGIIFEKNKIRNKVFIATKLPTVKLKSAADFDKFFDQQIVRLKTGFLDYYLMHMLTDMDQWNKLKSWGIEKWIDDKKKSGQVRQIGCSFHGTKDEFIKIVDDYDWEMCLMQYNYSNINYQAGVTGLKKAAEKMPVMIMEPLLGGRLAAGLPAGAVEIFKQANPDITPAGWALNWLWNQEEVTLLLSGMSSMDMVTENVKIAATANAGDFDDYDHELISKIRTEIMHNTKVVCTSCGYCLPCPKGVDIPFVFHSYNMLSSNKTGVMREYMQATIMRKEQMSISACNDCGKCEMQCPQGLEIRTELKNAARELETFSFRFVKRVLKLLRIF